jgi:hypothetical protein
MLPSIYPYHGILGDVIECVETIPAVDYARFTDSKTKGSYLLAASLRALTDVGSAHHALSRAWAIWITVALSQALAPLK